jgi:hypothetical protein
MGRAPFTVGTTDRSARVLDRSADRVLFPASEPGGDSPRSPSGTGSVLSNPRRRSQADQAAEKPHEEAEVVLHEIWSRLSLPDRQRFGHCFSVMVLKALGLRPCSTPEVES